MTDNSPNPLLELDGLPPFSELEPKHVIPAMDRLLAEGREAIERRLASPANYTWDKLAQPLEDIGERIDRAWSPVRHLHAVADNPELRDAYNACRPKLTDYETDLGQNEALHAAYRTIAEGGERERLTRAEQTALEHALRDFRLAGVDLPAEQKERFKAVSSRLSELGSKFGENVLDATQGWKKHVTRDADLVGLPDSAIALARDTAKRDGLDGWLLTLEFPSFLPVMNYADDRSLRREIYEAHCTRASDQGPNAGQWDNGPLIEEITALRHEYAGLLGFANFAEYSLARKMARSPDEVLRFLDDLAKRSKPVALRDLDELQAFARETHGQDELEAWDIAYYSEKLREHKYAVSQEELRPYFPAPRVIDGLFEVVKRLYGLKINALNDVETWHTDVQFFEIYDDQDTLRGQFYLDIYARPHKRGGAWMDECITRKRRGAKVQTPVAYLVCNFTPPVGDEPSLLTHNEVTTLFHEFGHGLHHMLTRVDCLSVAGIRGVPWDAVELPSQFMENWCWEREALALFSGHHETGEPLPDEMFDKLYAAKNFQSGMQIVRQLEFALFDFRLHLEYDPANHTQAQNLLDEVRSQVAVVVPPAFNRFAHGFSHIFAGGYAAGYYSYKWAEVLSSDAFGKFEERGIFDRRTGEEFLHSVLEQGGSRDAQELFVEFRGRAPSIEALLRHSGIESSPAHG